MNTDGCQTTIAQRLGERHKASDLITFLNEFHSSGVPHPDEFDCDESRALLNTGARTYSPFQNIDEYAANMKLPDDIENYKNFDEYAENVKKSLPFITRIRIDNAHFISKYKRLLKSIQVRGVYTLYMASVDQLLLALYKKDAAKIIKAIFIVANSPKQGKLPNGQLTECSKQIAFLKQLSEGNRLSILFFFVRLYTENYQKYFPRVKSITRMHRNGLSL